MLAGKTICAWVHRYTEIGADNGRANAHMPWKLKAPAAPTSMDRICPISQVFSCWLIIKSRTRSHLFIFNDRTDGMTTSSALNAVQACVLHAMEFYRGAPWRDNLFPSMPASDTPHASPRLRYSPRSSFLKMTTPQTVDSCKPGSHDDLINMSQLSRQQPHHEVRHVFRRVVLMMLLISCFCMCT